jgi:hypothetical protein
MLDAALVVIVPGMVALALAVDIAALIVWLWRGIRSRLLASPLC